MRFVEGSTVGTLVAGLKGGVGNGLNQFNEPTSIAVDALSNIYVSDSNNFRVMMWRANASTGARVAGRGLFENTAERFGASYGLAIDSLGNMYISDNEFSRVIKWTPNSTNGTLFAGRGISGSAIEYLEGQNNVLLDEVHSYLYVADQFNHRIVRYSLDSSAIAIVTGGNGAGPANNQFKHPSGVCVSKKTDVIYVSEFSQHRVQRWSPDAASGVTIDGTVGLSGSSAGLFNNPVSLALSPDETFLYVVDRSNHRVQRFQLICSEC